MLLLFIVNPSSGNGRGARTWREVEKGLKEKNTPYRVAFTKQPEDGIRLVHQFLSEIEESEIRGIIAVGGDGTLHEVANGILQSGKEITFGLIPAGSGNDFAREFKLGSWESALAHILAGKSGKIDVGVVNDRYYFVNNLGAGFDGEVSWVANRSWYKNWLNRLKLGKVAYILTLVLLLISFKRMSLTITIGQKSRTWHKAWLVAVGNIKNYGGGMMICPDAIPNDGKFQICVVHGLSPLKLLLLFPKVFSGKHKGHPAVELIEAEELLIETNYPCYVHMDGEVKIKTPTQIRIRKQLLNVFQPQL